MTNAGYLPGLQGGIEWLPCQMIDFLFLSPPKRQAPLAAHTAVVSLFDSLQSANTLGTLRSSFKGSNAALPRLVRECEFRFFRSQGTLPVQRFCVAGT